MSRSLVSFIVISLAVIICDIWCGDASTAQRQNPWQLNTNKNEQVNNPQSGTNLKSTTPWPALGPRNQYHTALRNVTQPPQWVRPNNGPNWVRNTPSPEQNPNNPSNQQKINAPSSQQNLNTQNVNNLRQNQNTLFLNNERGSTNVGLNSGGSNTNPQGISNNKRMGSSNMNVMQTTNNKPGGVNMGQNTAWSNNNDNNRNGAANSNKGIQNSNNRPSGISSGSMTANREPADRLNQENNNGPQNGDVDDNELRELAEELLSRDSNNAARHVTLNLQAMTTSRSMIDQAPLPLLSVNEAAFNIPSVSKMMQLYNNYILEANQNEVYTAQEKIEENDLLDIVIATPVMQHARNFLLRKGKIGRDPKEFRDLLRSIWFNMYSRGGGRIGSSGFEHVFLAEIKNNGVSGLHNWLYFSAEEKKNNANYLGYMKKIDLGNKGAILKYHFNFHSIDKPVGSMFIGTSPELEMALYSTCFILRADRICPLKMNGNRFIIRTYTYRYRGKNMIGSAFPEI